MQSLCAVGRVRTLGGIKPRSAAIAMAGCEARHSDLPGDPAGTRGGGDADAGGAAMRLRKPGGLALAVLLGLAGCVMPGAGVPVLSGAVTLAPPQGYCIEPGSRLEREDTAILIAGRCAGEVARPAAVLTATVGAEGSGSGVDVTTGGAELAAFFRSTAGRKALSRRGRAADVQVLEAVGTPQAFLLRLTDRAPQRGAGVQAESWRAVLPLNRRLVSLTVTGPAATPLDRAGGQALIRDFVAATIAANGK